MKNEVKTTNIRFNLGKEIQKKAWQYLQTMDKKKFKSYSNAVSIAIVYFFERYYRSENDPYLETREKEEKFIERIVSSVESSIEKSLPFFLSGCAAVINSSSFPPPEKSKPEENFDWDFLGE